MKSMRYTVNGEDCPSAEIKDVRNFPEGIVIEITYSF